MKIILDKLFSSGFLKSSLIVSVSKVISSLSNLVFMVYAVNIISKTENVYLQYYLGFLPVILAVAELGIPSAIVKYLSVEKTDLNKIGILNICVFSPPLMYSGLDFKIFREKILNKYELKRGFIMNSTQFADVKSWGLTFSVLKLKK
jgi:hypothetical protein